METSELTSSSFNHSYIGNFSIMIMALIFIVYTSNSIVSSDKQNLLNIYRIAESR